jgi:hypothetical protein
MITNAITITTTITITFQQVHTFIKSVAGNRFVVGGD